MRKIEASYWVKRASLTPEQAALVLGLPQSETRTAASIARAWEASRGLGPVGHAAKDLLLRVAEEERDVFDEPLDLDDDEPKPPEGAEEATLDGELSKAGIASGVDWKMWGGSNGGGKVYSCLAFVGVKGGKVVVAGIQHSPTGQPQYWWEVEALVLPPVKGDVGKEISKALSKLGDRWFASPVRNWNVWPGGKLTEQTYKRAARQRGGAPMKTTLETLGMGATKKKVDRAPIVEIVFEENELRQKLNELRRGPDRSPNAKYESYDIHVRVNGRQWQLDPATCEEKRFVQMLNRTTKVVDDGTVLNLSRMKAHSQALALGDLVFSLTHEPTECILALTQALEYYEDKEEFQAIYRADGKYLASRYAKLLSRVSSAEASNLLARPLSDLLLIEVSR
jgi:hypothetical protein